MSALCMQEGSIIMELDCQHASAFAAADYELALRLQVEDIPLEFMQEPFLLHEVLHSFFPHDVSDVDQLADHPETAQHASRNSIYLTHHAQVAMASSSSAVASHVPSFLPTPPEVTYHSGNSVTGEPFKLFFKGLLATLDDGPRSTVEAVIVAPSGAVVQEIASSVRPGISGRLVADYRALWNGLAAALELDILHVQAVGDSELLKDQMTGAVKIPSSTWKLASEVIDQINQLEIFELVILPKMDCRSTVWDLARELSEQSNKSTENSRAKMIAMEPSTDMQALACNELMVAEATTQGCSSALEEEVELQRDSSSEKMKMMMVVQSATDQRCNICLEDKTDKEMLTIYGCLHTFCVRCVTQHTELELKNGRIARCPEPSCKREMEVEQCGQFLSTELFEHFTRLIAEASIPEHERLYCPYADCSELFLKTPSSETMKWSEATCVTCKRNFCLSCEVPSHTPFSCAEYQELPPEEKQQDDLKLFEFAALSKWKRCGRCRMMIQRTQGCSHMTCRCGYEFCYTCQAKWRTCRCP